MPKEIKEKINEKLHKIFFKWHLHLPDIEIEITDQISELFEEEKQKWLKEKTDTNIKSQSTSCDHEWVMSDSPSSALRCIKCGLTKPKPIM